MAQIAPVILAEEKPFRVGSLDVEPSRLLLTAPDGAALTVEPRVMQALVTLAQAGGEVVSRETLLARCWSGRLVSEDAVERVIARLRRLARDPGRDSLEIETIPRVGYRLVGTTARAAGSPGAPIAKSMRLHRRHVLFGAAGVAAAAAGGFALLRDRRGADRPNGPLRVAVLPFTATNQGDVQVLALQTSDELRAHLSRIGDIRVIAETSSSAAASEGGSSSAIARRLDADLILEGQVSGTRTSVHVIASLVDPSDERQVWTETFEAPAGAITEMQLSIAGAVVQQIAGLIPLTANMRPALARRPDPRAHLLVVDANRLLAEVRVASMAGRAEAALDLGDRATVLADQAHAIDPDYGAPFLVLAIIARNGWNRALAGQELTTEQRVQRSIVHVRRALLADPNDPAALTQLGDYNRRYELRWDQAETLFRRALALNPSLVEAHWSYAYQLGTTGRGIEGLDHAVSVFELDPRNPFRRIALPRLLYVVGQRAAAMSRYEIELAQQPENLFLLRELQFMFLAEGNAAALSGLLAKIDGGRQGPAPGAPEQAIAARIRACVAALDGRTAQLKAMIDADVRDYDSQVAGAATLQGRARDDLPFIFSIEYAWAGDADRSLDMLERALTAKSLYWPASLPFGNAPFPPAVRTQARFAALWREDAGLQELVARRRRALNSGQMAGFGLDGRPRVPGLPRALVARIQPLLYRA